MGRMFTFEDTEWSSLLVIICLINIVCMFLQSTYSGILKRRYYKQIKREISLLASQVATICILFYAFKIGAVFSREMMFVTYIIYFVASQPIKYLRKKYINKEYPFRDKSAKVKVIEEDSHTLALRCIDNRSSLYILFSSFIKRTIDIVGGLVGCLILIPLTLIVIILNKLNEEDDGPVFFMQERIGQNGKKFKMLKFRSMVVDADERLESFLEENEDIRNEFYVYRKIKNDPRVTKVGRFLRKTSLDEFPQFINVLLGDMSIIGPRPYLERELEDMGQYYNVIVQYKPGITGLWQISGRSDVSFEDRLEMDIKYHKDHSNVKDIEILLKTVKNVISKEGAS